MDILRKVLGLPPDTRSEEEKESDRKLAAKIDEYSEHFSDTPTTVCVAMTHEEIIANIDKCIKHNRKWEGFIVPELDYEDVDI